MSLKHSLLVSFLLCLKGVFVQTDSFGVRTESVCAPVGSDVILWSSCKPPDGYTYISMTWTHTVNNNKSITDERKDSWIIYREFYRWCHLIIRNISETDSGVYYLSFTYRKGIFYKKDLLAEFTVHVTGLQVSIDSDHVTEGQNVTLTCESSCPPPLLPPGLFVWFRNGSRLDPRGSSDRLSVSALSSEGPLRFSCALKGFESIPSAETLLRVSQSDVWYEGAGLITLLILVILLFISTALWLMMLRKKRQPLKGPEEKEKHIENDAAYENDSTPSVTFDWEEKGKSVQQEEVHYSHVYFSRSEKAQHSATSAQEADVQYAQISRCHNNKHPDHYHYYTAKKCSNTCAQ